MSEREWEVLYCCYGQNEGAGENSRLEWIGVGVRVSWGLRGGRVWNCRWYAGREIDACLRYMNSEWRSLVLMWREKTLGY